MASDSQEILKTDKESKPYWLQEAVTIRSVLVGVLLILLAEGYITWAMNHLASRLNKSYLPMGLFFPFILVVLVK